jgi:hypothetical protein
MFQPQPTSSASVYFALTPSSSSASSSSPPLVNGHAYPNRHPNATTSSSSASPATSICSDLPHQQQQAPPPPSYGLAPSFVSGPSLIPVGGRGAGAGAAAGAGPGAVTGAAIGAPSGLENETGAPAGHFSVPRPGPGAVSVCRPGFASVGAAVGADSAAQHLRHGSRRPTTLQATLSTHRYSGPYRPARTSTMASHDQHDIAAQQAAAKDYQPVLEVRRDRTELQWLSTHGRMSALTLAPLCVIQVAFVWKFD